MFNVEALKHLEQSAVLDRLTNEFNTAEISRPAIVLPDGFSIHNIQHLFPHKQRQVGAMTTDALDSFVQFCGNTKGNKPTCFIDGDAMKAKVIFDYGDAVEPGHCDLSASLSLKPTAEYQSMLAIAGGQVSPLLTQQQVAYALEDLSHLITPVDSEGMSFPLSQAINAIRNVTIEAKGSANYQQTDQRAERSSLETIEAKAKNALSGLMPAFLNFNMMPYIGLVTREFRARVVIHLQKEAEPKFSLKLVAHELAKQDMAAEFVDLLKIKLAGSIGAVYVGQFKP